MKKKKKEIQLAAPYTYLLDNIKVFLIFLVVFNHLIAFQLVKEDIIIQYVRYAITIFHMPAFLFVSGYLSKKHQNAAKNVQNLLIPYIIGYTLSWYAFIWCGYSIDYDLLRPSGTVMWYILALFAYRLVIEGMGKIRLIVPISIAIALWAGTRTEFSTFLSASRIVVFFPFFVAGYLWTSDMIRRVRKFKAKWLLPALSLVILFAVPHYMITNGIPVDIFRGNHSYQVCGLTMEEGLIIRGLMYLVSFIIIVTFLAIIPDKKRPLTFIGRNTMSIYFFHYPIMIIANSLLLLKLPQLLNVWACLGIALVFVLVLGSPPVSFFYNMIMKFIAFLLFKKEKTVYKNKSLYSDDILDEEHQPLPVSSDDSDYYADKGDKGEHILEGDDGYEVIGDLDDLESVQEIEALAQEVLSESEKEDLRKTLKEAGKTDPERVEKPISVQSAEETDSIFFYDESEEDAMKDLKI